MARTGGNLYNKNEQIITFKMELAQLRFNKSRKASLVSDSNVARWYRLHSISCVCVRESLYNWEQQICRLLKALQQGNLHILNIINIKTICPYYSISWFCAALSPRLSGSHTQLGMLALLLKTTFNFNCRFSVEGSVSSLYVNENLDYTATLG